MLMDWPMLSPVSLFGSVELNGPSVPVEASNLLQIAMLPFWLLLFVSGVRPAETVPLGLPGPPKKPVIFELPNATAIAPFDGTFNAAPAVTLLLAFAEEL
jgi:hypothetical protein